MIHFKQGELVDLFCEKMRSITSTRTGTYNRADPTHFEQYRGEVWVTHGYGEYWITKADVAGYDCENGDEPFINSDGEKLHDEPPPVQVSIMMHDCTWGIEFEFETDAGKCGAYWSRESNDEGGEWVRVTGNFFEVFKDLFAEGSPDNPYEDFGCPHGYIEMYE